MTSLTCNNKRAALRICLAAALWAGLAGAAFAQALPWKTQSAPPQPAARSAPYYPPQNPAAPPRPAYVNAGAARAEDDKELNLLATRFYNISAKDPEAIRKLKALEGEVSRYRHGLSHHGYDARDIMKDARKLQGRIAHQRKGLEKAAAETPATDSGVKSIAPAGAVAPSAEK